jgi:hypothetical protein
MAMRFLGAIAAYLFMAIVLGWGILQAVHGSYWLLGASLLAYLVALLRIGCVPPKAH